MKRFLTFMLAVTLVISAGYIFYQYFYKKSANPFLESSSKNSSTSSASLPSVKIDPDVSQSAIHILKYEPGDFGPTPDRITYESGEMILEIPRLEYVGPVLSLDLKEFDAMGLSEDEKSAKMMSDLNSLLDSGVSLFNESMLPGPENNNVSIAGHRDFKGMEFYNIDKITYGDLIFLYYKGKKYTYEYKETFITNDSDWDPIAITEISQVTLQSCDPIFAKNGNYDRIFIIGSLIKIEGGSGRAE